MCICCRMKCGIKAGFSRLRLSFRYYLFVGGSYSWSVAYNNAKSLSFRGMKGYLATVTSAQERAALRKASTSKGWIGGTMLINAVDESEIGDCDSITQAEGVLGRPTDEVWRDDGDRDQALKLYYWACGPDADKGLDEELVNSDDEPNVKFYPYTTPWDEARNVLGVASVESCLVANFTGEDAIGDISEPGFTDQDYDAQGYFVEFGGYDEGKDPGDPNPELTKTSSYQFQEHEHTLSYSLDGNVLTARCTKENEGFCDIPAGGITLTLGASNTTYDGTAVDALGTSDERATWNAVGADLPSAAYLWTSPSDAEAQPEAVEEAKKAGAYTVTVTAGDADSAGVTWTGSFTIAQKEVRAHGVRILDKEYDGNPSVKFDYSKVSFVSGYGLVEGDEAEVYVDAEFEDENVGNDKTFSFSSSLVGDDASNYSLTLSEDFGREQANITPRVLTVNWSDAKLTYNGSPQAPTCTLDNVVQGESVYASVEVSGEHTNAGTYTAEAHIYNANYTLADSSKTTSFTIEKASFVPSVSISGWTYGDGAATPSVTGNPGGGDVTFAYSAKGKDDWSETVPTAAGEYTVRATVAETANYDKVSATADFTIAPREVTLAWSDSSFTYDGAEHVLTCTAGNLIGSDAVTVTVSGAKRDAGTGYEATASGLDNANYKLPAEGVTKTFSISPRVVTLAWDSTDLVYNGAEQTPTCSVSNKIGDDDVAVTVTGAKVNANESGTAKAETLIGRDADNYVLPDSGLTKSFVIAPLEARLVWANTSLVYSGKSQAPTCTVSNSVADDDVKVAVDGAQVDAGENYTAVAKSLTGSKAGNYALPASAQTTFSIAKASITPVVSIEGWTYGEAANAPSVKDSGNPGKGDVTYQYSAEGAEEWSSAVPSTAGNYTVRATVAETKNYLGGTDAENFIIAPRVAVLEWGATTFTYDGDEHVPACAVTNVLSDDIVDVSVTGARAEAGTAIATVQPLDNNNYALPKEGVSVEFTIKKASIAPAVSIADWTYGQAPSVVSITGNTGDGAATVEYAARADEDAQSEDGWSAEVPTEAGDYTVRATIAETPNYAGAVATADFSIARRSIESAKVVLGPGLTASDEEQEQAVESVTLADGTVLGASDYVLSGNKVTESGTYRLTVTGTGNYTGSVEVEFTVAPKPDGQDDDKGDDGKKDDGSDADDKGDGDDDSGKEDTDKHAADKDKLVGTGDFAATAMVAAAVAGLALATIGAIARRRTAA